MISPRTMFKKGVRAWKRIVYPWYVRYPSFWPRPEPRFRLYCVGLGKTGTHSIANVFKKHYRADHEVEIAERCCADLMREHFPDVTGPADTIRGWGED